MDRFEWHKRATESVAQGYLTNSKRPQSHIFGVYPTHIAHSRDCTLFDVNGKPYTDYICGLGTNLLGYGNSAIASAVAWHLNSGVSPSFATTDEVKTAEALKELFPFVDNFKFLKTGTEACMASIRIARAATGRLRVLTDGYHGWSDGFVSLTPPAYGCPTPDGLGFEKLAEGPLPSDTACVIVEPVMTGYDKARILWLRQLRERCDAVGALLIFDEVITGFRYKNYSVAQAHGVLPDLICIGKAIANGLPLAAVGGKREVMNSDKYFVSSTYAGDTLSLAACRAVISLLRNKYDIKELWEAGLSFQKRFNETTQGIIQIDGYATRGVFTGELLNKALFFQECCKAGIIFGPSWFFNFDLMQHTDKTLNTVKDIITRIKTGSVQLEGELPQSPFAQRVRENARNQ